MSNKYQLAWIVCVLQDHVARRQVGGKGKDGPSLFDGAVLFNELTESDHSVVNSEHPEYSNISQTKYFLCYLLLKIRYLTLPIYCDTVPQNLWICLMNNYAMYCSYFEVNNYPSL